MSAPVDLTGWPVEDGLYVCTPERPRPEGATGLWAHAEVVETAACNNGCCVTCRCPACGREWVEGDESCPQEQLGSLEASLDDARDDAIATDRHVDELEMQARADRELLLRCRALLTAIGSNVPWGLTTEADELRAALAERLGASRGR